jgi:uncharacterized protein (DUF488 family)
MSSPSVVWTIGHSNHELDRFVELLLGQRIGFLVDVRSYPYSRYAPHFNREELQDAIGELGVGYLFLGEALGGRPDREEHYDAEGHALYGPMAAEPAFQCASNRILSGGRDHRLALMCSCGQPRDCHRRLLVGKVLCEHGAELRHILPNGQVRSERSVDLLDRGPQQHSFFGENVESWRSSRSVSRRRRLSASSRA